MVQSFEDAGKLAREYVDSGLKSFAALSKGMQAATVETADYSRKSFEDGAAAAEQFAAAKTLEKAIEVQADYARQAYEGFVAQAARMSELFADTAREACKPFESVVAKAR